MHPVETFELVLMLLASVLALYWLAQRFKLPPAAVLLVGGGALAFVPGLPSVSLDPQLARERDPAFALRGVLRMVGEGQRFLVRGIDVGQHQPQRIDHRHPPRRMRIEVVAQGAFEDRDVE